VSINLKGQSRFLVNDIDILSHLDPSNASGSAAQNPQNANILSVLMSQVNILKSSIRSQNSRIEKLEQGARVGGGGGGATGNFSTPTERTKINRLNRRIAILEQRVANLTAKLTKDHCKSYPCQNGGTCFNMFETFRCECPENWEGPTCSLDVNECAKYVGTDLGCQNGATCINTVGSYE
jgi:cubilin